MALKEGVKAPAFNAITDDGKKVSLKDLSGKNIVLYFYPKDDTSGCTKEACAFNESLAQLKKLGAVVVGVSKDSVESHVKFKKKYDLDFQLIADTELKLCESYDVWKEKSLYGRKYMGIERTTYVIDKKGKIVKTFAKVKVDGHVEKVSEALKEMR